MGSRSSYPQPAKGFSSPWPQPEFKSQASRLQCEDVGQPFQFVGHVAATGRAKTAFDRFAGAANDFVIPRLPTHLHRSFRNGDDCCVGAATCPLAVPTVTVEHNNWIGIAVVMDGAARAPTGQFLGHGIPPKRLAMSRSSVLGQNLPA